MPRLSTTGGNAGVSASWKPKALALLSRATAYIELSVSYRRRSASQSEWSALFDMDPLVLCQLAEKDVEACGSLLSSHTSEDEPLTIAWLVVKAKTLAMNEKYSESKESFVEGLSIDPDNEVMLKGLKAVQDILMSYENSSKRQKTLTGVTTQDLDCIICMKLLFEPVTTPCGHSFCRSCFFRAVDHSLNRCPCCRTLLHCDRRLPVTILLQTIIAKSYPEEYEERRKEEMALSTGTEATDGVVLLPLFVMSTLLPGESMSLNIFEPRYRLMVRRALEGSRMIGMAQATAAGVDPVLCESEIMDCQPQPDGRYLLEIEGKRRRKIDPDATLTEVDGYRVARCKMLHDDDVAEADLEALEAKGNELAGAVDAVLVRIRDAANASGSSGSSVRAFLDHLGSRPVIDSSRGMSKQRQIEDLSFFAAAFLSSFSSALERHSMKHALLKMTSTIERVNLLLSIIPNSESTGRCSIM
jgi:hypothetical protein